MAKNKGYVSIWRDLQEHTIWTCEPFSKGQAWIDLLLMANYKENSFVMGNEVIKAEVGSVITSELRLMNRWKWSKKKLRSFMKLLEDMEMIKRIPNHKRTTIFILNYKEYQQKETTEETAVNPLFTRESKEEETTEGYHRETTERPRRDHEETVKDTQTIKINKENKENKENNTKRDTEKVSRHQYGEYKNVLLSDEELKKLSEEAPEVYLKKIEDLSCYMKSTGKVYKSHFATVRNWIRKDQKKEGEIVESGDKGKTFDFESFL